MGIELFCPVHWEEGGGGEGGKVCAVSNSQNGHPPPLPGQVHHQRLADNGHPDNPAHLGTKSSNFSFLFLFTLLKTSTPPHGVVGPPSMSTKPISPLNSQMFMPVRFGTTNTKLATHTPTHRRMVVIENRYSH